MFDDDDNGVPQFSRTYSKTVDWQRPHYGDFSAGLCTTYAIKLVKGLPSVAITQIDCASIVASKRDVEDKLDPAPASI